MMLALSGTAYPPGARVVYRRENRSPSDVELRLQRLSRSAKQSAQQAEDDREARDLAIREADRAGWGLSEIARACELSPGHIQRVLVKMTARDQQAAEQEAAP